MGTRGPAPKRSDQRRRTNKPVIPVTKAAAVDVSSVPMRSNAKWHPVAKRWFDSLAKSGQSKFYTPSDWATAYVIAESISRELKPRPVSLGEDAEGKTVVVMHEFPPRGAAIAAWLKGMTSLLATEGDRRRAQLELQRPAPPVPEGGGNVSWIDDARSRLGGSG